MAAGRAAHSPADRPATRPVTSIRSVQFSLLSPCAPFLRVESWFLPDLRPLRNAPYTLFLKLLHVKLWLVRLLVAGVVKTPPDDVNAQGAPQAATAALPDIGERKTITEADCTATKLGTTIPAGAIGEPVSSVSLSEPKWTAATDAAPAYCTVDGSIAPVDPAARPINFRVVFPASWTLRAAQLGRGGMNGIIPNLTGGRGAAVGPAQGIATFGSDSGHGIKDAPEWTLVDEAIRNLGYMQMKKTHDAAMVAIDRMYGRKPGAT